MALKFKINKSAYDAMSDEFKAEYVAGEKDGEFVLDVSDLPQGEDTGPLKRALESERGKFKTLKTELDAAKLAISEFPDVEALKAEHGKEVGKFKTYTEKSLIDGEAFKLAAKISTTPKLLAKDIRDRLVIDLSGDEPSVKIKGADGKVDDKMTFDKLGEEYLANVDYKNIMIGSKASGGGAPKPGTKPSGGGAPAGEDGKPVNLANLSGKDMAARIGERKAAEAAEAGA